MRLNLRNMLTILDDIEVVSLPSESERQSAIDFLAKYGITEIRGMPVTERFVRSSSWYGTPPILTKLNQKLSEGT